MSNDKMREEFEAWARSRGMDLEYRNIPGVGQFYECPRTLLALEAWQASRAAIVITLPSYTDYLEQDMAAAQHVIHDIRGEIELSGMNVK